jgi:hypothetical protein
MSTLAEQGVLSLGKLTEHPVWQNAAAVAGATEAALERLGWLGAGSLGASERARSRPGLKPDVVPTTARSLGIYAR